MTDQELINRLRYFEEWSDVPMYDAADRIEDLLKFSSYWHNRAEALEAKIKSLQDELDVAYQQLNDM